MRRILKGTVVLGFVGVLLIGLLTGCGSGDNNETKTKEQKSGAVKEQPSKQEQKSLRVTMALSEEEWEVMKKYIITPFEKENSVKVEAIQVEAGDVVKKLEAMRQAGKMEIDLIAQDVNNIAPLVSKGLVEDLSEFTNTIPNEAIESLVNAGKFEDATYFLPYRPNVEINFYNEVKFNEYGLTPPKTWDELLNVAKTLKEKEGIGRLALKMKLTGNVIEPVEFIRQAGGDPLVLNDEGSIKAYTFLQELWPYLSEDSLKAGFSSTNSFLANESVYYAPNWPFGVNIIVKDGGKKEIKAYSGFSGPVKAAKTLGGEVIGVPVGSPNKELALKFTQYLMSKEVQQILVIKLG